MLDRRNQKSEWSKYFVSNVSFEKVELKRAPKILTRIFYSFEARRNISDLLDEFKPDIAHLHSIYHHISPSIILELKKRNIPIVQTLHDYHLIAPSHTLFHNGRICEVTKKRKFYKAILHKCVKDSYTASLLEAIEQYLHNFLGIYKNVDIFIAPSHFMANKLVEYGLPKDKIQILHTFCDYEKYKPRDNSGEYILYFGRLSEEKGLDFLISAVSRMPNMRLKIAGTGLIENTLIQKVKKLGLTNIEFLGNKDEQQLKRLIYGCKFVILPSLCYENFPMSVMEVFSCGKPVLASKIGGIPELVKNGFNGFLFEPGNEKDWKEKIEILWNSRILCSQLGKNARNYAEENFSPAPHYESLFKFYKSIVKS